MVETTVHVGGMMCSMCETHIKEALRKAVPDGKKFSASHAKGIATFQTESAPDAAAVEAAIRATGYDFNGLETGEVAKKGFHLFG